MSRDELRAAADKEVDRWEQALTDELLRLFDRQEAVVLARLQGTKARKHTRHWEPPGDRPLEVKGIIDPVRWLLDAAGSTRPLITRLFGSVYGRVAKQLDADASTDPGDDRLESAIKARLDLISKGVKTAQEEVERLIKREEDAGTPMPEIVSQVRDLYHDRKPSWAARIATVSAVGSINQAALFAAADAGSSAKQWLSRRDNVVRDTHEHADGQVRLLDERFRLGGIPTHPRRSLLMFPGDPGPSVPLDEIMNCRCTLLFSPPRKKRLDEKAYVRTEAGAAKYGQEVGEEIVADQSVSARRRPGRDLEDEPTTVRGYQRMFDQVPVAQWGGGDVSISHQMPDGRRVWLYGDTLSEKNGFVHSTALVQSGSKMVVSKGGKQVLPNGGKDPADPNRELIYWPDGVRQGPTRDTLIVTGMEMSIGKGGPWDFRKTRDGSSREAVVRVDKAGNLEFMRWRKYVPTPTVGNPHLTDDFETLGPNHYAYGEVTHDIKLANGEYLTTKSQNYDDDFSNHVGPNGFRFKDYRPILGSTPTKPQRKDADLDLEEKASRSGPRRVRTAGGAQQYGQAIGTVIRADVIGKIDGLDVELAGRDKAVRRMVATQKPGLDQTNTRIAALRDGKGRIGAYVVWDKTDGRILEVSVHPKLRGRKLGDKMVAVVAEYDPKVQIPSRPAQNTSTTAAPARPVAPSPAPPSHGGAGGGVPKIRDLSRGEQGGTTGDFDADEARIDRLHKAYAGARQDTSSLFSRGGRWTPEREKLHQAIVDDFLNKPGVKADRKLLVLGGMPGAGKTTTLNSAAGQSALGVDLAEYVTVNSDEVKAEMIARGMVPDYPGLSPEESMGLIQAESYEIAQVVMRQAAKRGLNMAYDATLRTAGQLGAPEAAIARHAPPGYETTMVLVDVPVATALQRARDRYLGGDRYVPLGFISGMKSYNPKFDSAPAENFEGFKRRVDKWAVFDNSGAGPVLVAQGGKKAPAGAPAPAAAPAAAPVAPAAPAAPAAPVAASGVIPEAPAGAAVYRNKSGKVIHVLPDGSLAVYKPDGKPTRSTATAAKLAEGYGDWTHVSGPVPSSAPAPAAPAPSTSPMSSPAGNGSPVPQVPANLPTPPAGARVFSHPQGKHIYLLPDGSLVVYKPDGKRGTSSATAAKLLAGYGGWSELGANTGTAMSATPTPPAAPKKSSGPSPTVVAAPTAPLDVSAGAPAPSGSMPVAPMDFNEMPLADVPKYIADDDYVAQQKVDGIRGVLVIEPGKQPWFASKKGDRLVSSTAARTTTPMLAKLPATPAGSPAYRVEGEILNGKFHVFDMVVVGQESTDYETRQTMAQAWVDAVSPALPQVQALPVARTAAEKQALWDAVLASGAEGLMFKRRDAGYNGGARVSHTLKAKITATADVVVLERNRGGKDNAVFGMLQGGKVVEIGTVSTGGKDKALGQIQVGEVLEVEYLWATAGTNVLTQPRIVRKRKDKTPNDATDVSQLRFVDKTVLALAAKSARLRLEYAVEGAE